MSLVNLKKELPSHIINLNKDYKQALSELSERKRITKSYHEKIRRAQDIKTQIEINKGVAMFFNISYDSEA
jgi:hypothetical protein